MIGLLALLSIPTDVHGEKMFCVSFCASLIAGSRRAFLCVDSVRLLLEFWVKCTRCERLLPVKHFYLTCLLFLRRLKITLDSEQPMLKEKRIIPSVWGGIKSFEHFQRGEYFFDCSFDLFVSWFRLLSPGWIKTHSFFKLVNTFSHAQIYSLCRTSFILLFSQRTILCAVKLSRKYR